VECCAKYGENIDWTCSECSREKEIHPYVCHLFFIYRLQASGYPFSRNDLSLEEWLDLSVIRMEVEAKNLGAGDKAPEGEE